MANIFKKLFKKRLKVSTETEGTLMIRHLNDDRTCTFSESLGLSEERMNQLVKAAHEAYHTSSSVSEAGEKFSKICRHPNELFFATYVLADQHFKQNMVNSLMSKTGHTADKDDE